MSSKTKGICPFCKEEITPVVLEENTVRRDKCQCPECENNIYACRSGGCDNYAKGGKYYDQELCPECTRSALSTAKETAVIVGTGVLIAMADRKINRRDEEG